MWRLNADRGGKENANIRGISHSSKIAAHQGGGKVAEKDTAEDQKQSELLYLIS